MRLLVFDKNEPVERVIRLTLREVSNGSVDLVVVDGEGTLENKLLKIKQNGKFYLYPNVLETHGFKLDRGGRVIVESL